MAAVAGLATMDYLTIGLISGIGFWTARSLGQAPERHEPSVEQKLEHQFREEYDHWGISVPAWQNMNDKINNFGGNRKGDLALLAQPVEWDKPWKNPLDPIIDENIELATFDRADTFLALDVGTGQVRPSKRVPIVASLTEEIYHPDMPWRVSEFGQHKDLPNDANFMQRQVAVQDAVDQSTRNDQFLRKHYDIAFMNRAPGQSFRYDN